MMSNRPDPTTLPPAAVRIIARQPDGSEADVTEGMQALFDALLDTEDAIYSPHSVGWRPVAAVAQACDLRGWQPIVKFVAEGDAWHVEQEARIVAVRAERDARPAT